MKKDIRKESKMKKDILRKFYTFVEQHGCTSYRRLYKYFSDEELKILGYVNEEKKKA